MIYPMYMSTLFCLLLFSPWIISQNIDDDLLTKALDDVFHTSYVPSYQWNPKDSLSKSSIRRRCYQFLACEFHVPVVEVNNAIFHNGALYVANLDSQSRSTVSSLKNLYAGEASHLPSVLVQRGGRTDWIPGPKIIMYDGKNSSNNKGPTSCDSIHNTSIHFLFPWEVNNAFHSINDNVLSVLASIVMQRYYYHMNPSTMIHHARSSSLLMFRKLGGDSPSISLLYRIIHQLFDSHDIIPANIIMTGGSHCVRQLTWGTAMKPFYRDSLIELRRVIFRVFYHVLRHSSSYPVLSAPELRLSSYHNTTNIISSSSYHPRVIIITRNSTRADPSPYRKLSRRSEVALQAAFHRHGAPAVICCNFQYITTTQRLLSYFGHVDICIGIHGAGLTNCILASENVIVVELQNDHAYGFDSFMKIAHMMNGVYIFYDIRKAAKHRGTGAGAILDHVTIDAIVKISMMIHHHIRQQRDQNMMIDYTWLYEAVSGDRSSHIIIFHNDTSSSSASSSSHQDTSIHHLLQSKIAPVDRDKFLIIPSPKYQFDKNPSAILGPKLEDNANHCRNQDYFKFRKLLKSPMQDKDHCDRNFIHRKPAGLTADNIHDFLNFKASDRGLLPS